MTLTTYPAIEQGTDEWFAARCGIVTASVVGQLITKGSPDPVTLACARCGAEAGSPCISTARKVPTPIKTIHDERAAAASLLPAVYRVAAGDMARTLAMTLTAERITGHVEPINESSDMIRGSLDEPYARDKYAEHHAPVQQVGFIVRDDYGFPIGYSPDGLVGDDGLIEIKSRKQKIQLKTILEDTVPQENMAQIQCGLLVTGRDWCDYISYSGGMPLYVKRVHPDPQWHAAIIDAVAAFEDTSAQMIGTYNTVTAGLPTTERIDHFAEMEIY